MNSTSDSRFQRMVRRHSRLLTFVGAFIVFITFVVKEGVKDHVSDAVNSLKTAEGIFLVRDELNESLSACNIDDNRVKHLYERQLTSGNIALADVEEMLAVGRMQQSHMTTEIDNVYRLAAYLPEKRTGFRHYLDDFRDFDAKNVYQQSQKIVELEGKAEWEERQQYGSLQERLQNVSPELRNQTYVYTLAAVDSARRIIGFGQQVLAYCEELKRQEELKLVVWTWVSYALYAFGWGLGLFAKLNENQVGVEE